MRIVHDYPPNFDAIDAAFSVRRIKGVIFTYGDVIYVPGGEEITLALRAHELEVGCEYFVLLTTSAGLYRYQLGDLVRVVGRVNAAPLIEFLNKGEHTCSLAGEKLTEHQVILAMDAAARRLARVPVEETSGADSASSIVRCCSSSTKKTSGMANAAAWGCFTRGIAGAPTSRSSWPSV